MPQTIKILIVGDNDRESESLVRELYRAGFDPHWLRVETEEDYVSHLGQGLNLILSDSDMTRFSSLRALDLLKQSGLEIPFVIVSGEFGVETAVKAMEAGATGYLLKETIARLGPTVRRAMKEAEARPIAAGLERNWQAGQAKNDDL
jgi:DNA-binding NtrC family response regulator